MRQKKEQLTDQSLKGNRKFKNTQISTLSPILLSKIILQN